MNRCMENIELVAGLPGEKFFVTHADIPYKVEDFTITHYVRQIRNRVLERLHEVYGVDISDESIRKAVSEHNEVCQIITELGQFR